MKTARLLKRGQRQAVCLPREFRFDGSEVLIRRMGSAVVLLPKAKSWETLISSLAKFPPDFMAQREQPGDTGTLAPDHPRCNLKPCRGKEASS